MEPLKDIAQGEGPSLLPYGGVTIDIATAQLLLARYEQLGDSHLAVSSDGIIEVDEHHGVDPAPKGEVIDVDDDSGVDANAEHEPMEIDEDHGADGATRDVGAGFEDERILHPSRRGKVSCGSCRVSSSRSLLQGQGGCCHQVVG